MKTLSLWIFEILFVMLTGANELRNFPENFVVVNRSGTATLSCGPEAAGDVRWKFNGHKFSEVLNYHTSVDSVSHSLTVTNVDTPMVGEYSCWMGEKKLMSTYLLLEHEDVWSAEFHCRAKSYDCNFSCTWKHSGDTVVRLGLGHDCTRGEKSCQWVTKSVQDGGFEFEFSHSLLPFVEETTKLVVAAEATDNVSFLKGNLTFYLRDIVQPDSPQIITWKEAEEELYVTIEPPSTWSTPHSFFPLEHQIEYQLRDDGKIKHSLSTLIPKSINKLRVRSRDPLVRSRDPLDSHWSQWTPWKDVNP